MPTEEANKLIDYLILPDEKTAKRLKTAAAHNYINRYLLELRRLILEDDSWIRVGEPVPTDETEVIEMYRRIR